MSLEPRELDESVHRDVTRLCAAGDELAEQGRYEGAVAEYNKAWELIPEPKNDWNASTWILAAISDACFSIGKNKSARQALEYAMTCPGGLGNPFLHLRLFDAAEYDVAADELMRAYMGGGSEIFESEDPKYLTFLKTRATI